MSDGLSFNGVSLYPAWGGQGFRRSRLRRTSRGIALLHAVFARDTPRTLGLLGERTHWSTRPWSFDIRRHRDAAGRYQSNSEIGSPKGRIGIGRPL